MRSKTKLIRVLVVLAAILGLLTLAGCPKKGGEGPFACCQLKNACTSGGPHDASYKDACEKKYKGTYHKNKQCKNKKCI